MMLDADEQILDVLVGIDAVESAGRDDALEHGEILRAFDMACEEEVLSSDRDRPQAAFCEVVVEGQLWILDESTKRDTMRNRALLGSGGGGPARLRELHR